MTLTQEQKDANKAARKIRNKAWRMRRDLLDQAELVGKAGIASRYDDDLYCLKNSEIDLHNEIEDKKREKLQLIQALERDIELLTADRRRRITPIREERDQIYTARRLEENELRRILDERFPDLKNDARWSVAVWDRQQKQIFNRNDSVASETPARDACDLATP